MASLDRIGYRISDVFCGLLRYQNLNLVWPQGRAGEVADGGIDVCTTLLPHSFPCVTLAGVEQMDKWAKQTLAIAGSLTRRADGANTHTSSSHPQTRLTTGGANYGGAPPAGGSRSVVELTLSSERAARLDAALRVGLEDIQIQAVTTLHPVLAPDWAPEWCALKALNHRTVGQIYSDT